MGGSEITTPPYQDVNTSVSSVMSNIVQVDGLDSIDSTSSSEDEHSEIDDSNVTTYDSQDEIDPDTTPIIIPSSTKPSMKQRKIMKASSLPLVTRGANSGGAWAPSAQKGFQLAEIIWSGLPQLSQNYVLGGKVSANFIWSCFI